MRLFPCLLLLGSVASPGLFACGAGPTSAPTTPAAATSAAATSAAPTSATSTEATSSPPAASSAPNAPASPPRPSKPAPEPVHHDASELDPSKATAHAPEVFRARFSTTQGDFVIEVHRAWAPNGADRFYNLVKMGVFDDTRVFRAIEGFMAQFGIPGDPKVAAAWRFANIKDDSVNKSNERGFVTFAQTGAPNSRSTQVFINYKDNFGLDHARFAPFGQVVDGMNVVDSLYKGYGEGAPEGQGPDQARIQRDGNAYLDKEFPKLDRILRADVVAH